MNKLGPYPIHGPSGFRWLREGKYNKRRGKTHIGWLIHHSAHHRPGTILKDKRGNLYQVQAAGNIVRMDGKGKP